MASGVIFETNSRRISISDVYTATKKAINLQEEKPFDIVHCRSYIPSLIGLKLKRSHGVKFIFDMRGFWADERIEGNIWNLKNPIYKFAYRFFKRMELIFLQESDAIITLTENARNELLTWQEVTANRNKIRVIPCCVDPDLFFYENIDPFKQARLRHELGIAEESLVLGYSGSIGTWYLLDEMLHFYTCLLRRQQNAVFLFITPDDAENIYASARHFQIEKEKIIVRYATRDEMPVLLSLCDTAIFFIKNTWSKKAHHQQNWES